MHDYAHGNEAVLAARPMALLHTGKRDTITRVAIQGFKCADTQELFETDRSQQFGSIRKLATRKLGMLDAAATLKDLESPPGNRLEALTKDRAGQHSIRINDQWRICFVWTEAGPTDVEITKHYQ